MLYKQVHNKICCEHVCTTCRQQIEQVEFGRASLCTHVLTTVSCRSVQQCAFSIHRRLMPGNNTRRWGLVLCAVRYDRLGVRQRHAVHRR